MEGMIFDIRRFSTVDGPGIRSTFFRGCNLKCKWCNNPESRSMKPLMLIYINKCISCGKCTKICLTKMKDCNLCGECTFYCPTDARCIYGKNIQYRMAQKSVMHILLPKGGFSNVI